MNNKENEEIIKERIHHIFELRKESELQFDKQLRYIAAGAIALSVTLISSIQEISINWVILVAWILLIVTLLVNLISFKIAVKALDYEIVFHPKTNEENKNDKWTKGLNIASIITLVTGLTFLVLFFYKIK